MYANYLIDVGKLVFIVGDTESTTQFRNLFQSAGNPKQKIFYKCMEQLPADTYKKEKNADQKKGIIRKDWFTKILNKNPQMIVMTFNCTAELAENQVWEDRLKVMIKRINKVYDAMKSNNKQQVRLKIIVLISKHTFGGVNLHQKITNFLKNYGKELNIIQIEYYGKEIAKIRSQWVYGLDKNYENKYKKIQKRWEESYGQKKLGCMVKMTILSEMLGKKEEKNKYLETYGYLKKRFDQTIRTVNILNHNQIRQVRAVSDVIFLRFLKSLISSNTTPQLLFKQTQQHMNYFKLKNLGLHQTSKYYYYQQLLWRCTFIQNFLEILYKNDLMETVSTLSLCELLNELVTYLHALAVVEGRVLEEEKMLGAKIKEERQENFVGLVSYRGEQVLQTDIVFTFMSDIISHKKDYLSKGIQLITRYKTMNIFKPNQLLFLNIYLLRLYFRDNKFQSFINTYDQIMRQEISRSNYFLLNQIFNEIQEEFREIGQEHKVMFYGMSCLICDYFENSEQLQSRLQHLLVSLKQHQAQENSLHHPNPQSMLQSFQDLSSFPQSPSQLNEQYRFSLKKKSNIAAVSCFIRNEFVYIEDEIRLKFQIRLNSVIVTHGCKVRLQFSNKTVDTEIIVPAGSPTIIQKTLTITPLQHFTHDSPLRIESILITLPSSSNLTFTIPNNHIHFLKFKQNKIFTKIKCPEIDIRNPFTTYYINEICKFEINVEKLPDFTMEAKCSIKEEDPYGKTEVFADFQEKINLVNSNYYQELVTKDKTVNQFWLKCNKIGEKTLKFTFHFVIQKIIETKSCHDLLLDSSEQSKQPPAQKRYVLRQPYNVTKELKFTIQELFQFKKVFSEFSNDDSRLLENKNVPVGKNIVCVVEVTPAEDVWVKEIGQHKNPKKIQYLKEIHKSDMQIKKNNKLKLNMVFHLTPQCKDQIQLFLMSIYVKWSRLSSALPLTQAPNQNLFLDNETKINCYTNPLSIFMTTPENYLFKKNELNKIRFRIKNHSDFKNHVLIIVDGNPVLLRVGERGKEVFVEPGKESAIEFDMLPVASGFLPLPGVKVFVDGVERNMNLKNGQVIKCM